MIRLKLSIISVAAAISAAACASSDERAELGETIRVEPTVAEQEPASVRCVRMTTLSSRVPRTVCRTHDEWMRDTVESREMIENVERASVIDAG